MNDTPEPNATPEPTAETERSPEAKPPFEQRSPNPGRPGTPRQPDRFPRGSKPKSDGSKPPQLDTRDFGGTKPNTRALDQSIEDELEAALKGFEVDATVTSEAPRRSTSAMPGTQGKKKGTVVSIHGKDVFVEVPGGRSQGVLPLMQFEGKTPKIGQEVEFEIERYNGNDGLLVLTMQGAAQAVSDWSSVSTGMIVEARVTGTNKNKTGLTVEVNGIQGFLPASQIDMYRVENIDQFLNQRLKCQIVELEPSERNLVLSRRALLERERQVKAEQFWATIEEGQIKEGIVRGLKPFGVFVDLGGADGLIPIGEMSWSRVNDPSELVSIGDKVEVMVAKVDHEKRKIGLSLRATIRSPWDDFAEQHRLGARLTGTVTRLMDFGAFVEVAPGIEGLVHVSELSTQRVRRVADVVKEGQQIEVQILSIDTDARRMSLSLKSLKAEAEAAEDAAADAEEQDDRRTAEERMANRSLNPNLRGGIGS